MSTFLRYSLILVWLAALVSCGNSSGVKLPDMSRSYSKRSKKPFGTFVAHQMLKEKYKLSGVESMTKSFYKSWVNRPNGKRSLYVIISKKVLLSQDDLEAMLQYVNNGNQLFISAEYIDQALLDTLNIEVEYYSINNLLQSQLASTGPMRYSTVELADSSLLGKNKYGFFFYPFDGNFEKTDSSSAVILGINDSSNPDYISVVHGKGRIFFHLHPQAFSNYFLLSRNNKEYFEKVFSYMAPVRYSVYWDDYYRLGNEPNEDFSSFAVFMKYPMLKWALLIAISLMLLYIAFGSKRKQRPVPVKEKNTNASVSFAETIGRLYLQKKDNHNIAHKMITYFMEHIRTHYYLNTSQLNAEFFSSLAKKSGVNEPEVKSFFQTISQLQEAAEISDQQLLELNNRMQIFLKS